MKINGKIKCNLNESNETQALKQQLAAISGTDYQSWFLVSRARYGMELVLRALADTRGRGEVITQPLTCITAVNPILYAGHTPVYCDIKQDNLSIDTKLLPELITKTTRAIIVQHSFGMPADVAGLPQGTNRPVIVEDSAHRLGFIARLDKKPVADISIHSFGAEKLLSTRFGGAVWVNPEMQDKELRNYLVTSLQQLQSMRLITSLKVRAYPPLNGILNRLPTRLSKFTRKALMTTKLLYSPIVPTELAAGKPETAQLPSKSTVRAVLKELEEFEANLQARSGATGVYVQATASSQFTHTVPKAALDANLPCIRFPILLDRSIDADEIFWRLRAQGYGAGKWYRPLLFPGPKSYATYSYVANSCPVAEDTSSRLINLPTAPNITSQKAQEIIYAIDH